MKETFSEIVFRKNQKEFLAIFLLAVLVGIVSILYTLFFFFCFKVTDIDTRVVMLTLFSMISIVVNEVYIFVDRYSDKLSKNIENSKRGIEGEESAKKIILETVGNNGRVFFNKDLPTGGDIDCLILGKKGLILIEIKNFSKQIWLPLFWTKGFYDPRNEAKRHAVGLMKYLSKNGYSKPLKIRKAVLYINKEVSYWGKQEVFNIRGLDRFARYVLSLPLDSSITNQDMVEISSLIEKLK